jgi:hypothetical protein
MAAEGGILERDGAERQDQPVEEREDEKQREGTRRDRAGEPGPREIAMAASSISGPMTSNSSTDGTATAPAAP